MSAGETTDDLSPLIECGRAGRSTLIDRIHDLVAQLRAARTSERVMFDNLTSVQARCTELVFETRELRGGIVLEGWTCPACGRFNGGGRETCRCCDAARPR